MIGACFFSFMHDILPVHLLFMFSCLTLARQDFTADVVAVGAIYQHATLHFTVQQAQPRSFAYLMIVFDFTSLHNSCRCYSCCCCCCCYDKHFMCIHFMFTLIFINIFYCVIS